VFGAVSPPSPNIEHRIGAHEKDGALVTAEVRTELIRVLGELGIEEAEITDTAALRTELGLDSTETVQVALELGRHFGVKVTLESGADLTVQDVCALVTALTAGAAGAG
jgi:acyl carrier protein